MPRPRPGRTRLAPLACLIVALVAALILAACGGDDDSSSGEDEGGTTTIAGESANDHGSQDVSGTDEASLEMDDFYFEPTILTGEAGQTLKIELENEGDATHNFSTDDKDFVDVEPGEDASVTVTFPDSGTLAFFCKFHDSQGMRGALLVGS